MLDILRKLKEHISSDEPSHLSFDDTLKSLLIQQFGLVKYARKTGRSFKLPCFDKDKDSFRFYEGIVGKLPEDSSWYQCGINEVCADAFDTDLYNYYACEEYGVEYCSFSTFTSAAWLAPSSTVTAEAIHMPEEAEGGREADEYCFELMDYFAACYHCHFVLGQKWEDIPNSDLAEQSIEFVRDYFFDTCVDIPYALLEKTVYYFLSLTEEFSDSMFSKGGFIGSLFYLHANGNAIIDDAISNGNLLVIECLDSLEKSEHVSILEEGDAISIGIAYDTEIDLGSVAIAFHLLIHEVERLHKEKNVRNVA